MKTKNLALAIALTVTSVGSLAKAEYKSKTQCLREAYPAVVQVLMEQDEKYRCNFRDATGEFTAGELEQCKQALKTAARAETIRYCNDYFDPAITGRN